MADPLYGPVRLLVVQPTPFCNLDCDYCYLPDRGDRTRMSFAVLEAAVARVLDSPYFAGGFTLLWHAGEPLMALHLVAGLQARGVRCWTATTERRTEVRPDGTKVSVFGFVRFRAWPRVRLEEG